MKSWQDECSQTNLYKVELRKTEYFIQIKEINVCLFEEMLKNRWEKLDSKQSGKA